MKKLYFLIVAVIFTVNFSFAQTGWVDYKIDNKVSVKLPAQPRELGGGTVSAPTLDSTLCVVTLVDFKAAAGLDSAAIAQLLPQPEFADGIRTGMQGQMKDFTLSEAKSSKLNGYYSFTIDGDNPTKKLKSYTMIVVIGQYGYSFTALVKYGVDTKYRDEFFASVQAK